MYTINITRQVISSLKSYTTTVMLLSANIAMRFVKICIFLKLMKGLLAENHCVIIAASITNMPNFTDDQTMVALMI